MTMASTACRSEEGAQETRDRRHHVAVRNGFRYLLGEH
jgi:hypothetical protein